MRRHKFSICFLAAACVLSCGLIGTANAEVKLPAVFGDHMVLQCDHAVNFWGTADAGETVTVSVAGQKQQTKADKQGQWKLALGKLSAGGPHKVSVKGSSGSDITLSDVLVGEVWVCSGQSNMVMSVGRSNNAEEEIKNANFPNIRLIKVPTKPVETPQSDFQGQWAACSPETVANFSAAGYFFGRRLHKDLKVPVGLIFTAVGGTPAEAWTSREALDAQESLKPLFDRWAQSIKNYDPEKTAAENKKRLEAWKVAAAKAKEAGKPVPRRPRPIDDPKTSTHRPANLYNGMVAPIIPYTIRGAIWYQGESNSSRAYQYRTVFRTMIQDWRARWNQGDFPFILVQLANFHAVQDEPGDSTWAELREAQLMTRRHEPNTGMAVIIDVGEADDIHPKDKQTVGKRLALWALANTYGQKIEYSGPVLESAEHRADSIVLTFSHADGGLVAKGGKELKGFTIAGKDKKFVRADAKIQGNKVIVSQKDVKNPESVRYGWADNPVCNLYNKADLPASPFRTDTWKGITADAN